MSEKQHFAYLLRPPRPNFPATLSPEEEAVVERHFNYLKNLLDKNELLMAGRCVDGSFGITVFEAETENKAKAIMDNDPAVKEKVMTAELFPFRISLWQIRRQR